MRRPPIELHKGELRITNSALHLDAKRRVECAFVSHAHGDHIGRHDRTIATAPTIALMRHRLGEPKRRKTEALPVGYRTPFGLGELTLELFSAGHVLGSAQLRVTRNEVAVGYTGDLCTEPTHAAEQADVMPCDVLVMESTFGHPRYVFPAKEETLAAVRKFVDDALSDGATPVLLGYALGKAQEILKFLSGAGYACRAHPVVHAVNRIYEAEGVALPNVRPLGPEGAEPGEVVVAPPHLSRSPAMRRPPPSPDRHPDRLGDRRRALVPRRGRGVPALRPRRLPVAPALRQGDRRLARLHGARPRRCARRRAPQGGRAGRAVARAHAARAAVAAAANDPGPASLDYGRLHEGALRSG